jgi:hypothetical protein
MRQFSKMQASFVVYVASPGRIGGRFAYFLLFSGSLCRDTASREIHRMEHAKTSSECRSRPARKSFKNPKNAAEIALTARTLLPGEIGFLRLINSLQESLRPHT